MSTHLGTAAKLEYVSPDLLDFDPNNPRVAGQLSGCTQDEIQKHIFGEPHYASELVDSLVENGFIDYEPLVVKRRKNRYLVIEGNRRLSAIKEIRAHPEKYAGRKSDLESIPVLVFPAHPDEQQENEMRAYLGVRHLLGFRGWPPLSKAQYLEHRSKVLGGLDKVINETQLKKREARRFLIPYRLLQDARVALPPGEDFWVLGEALGRNGIKEFLQLEVDSKTLGILRYNKKNLSLLLDDLYGPKKNDGVRDASKKLVRDTRGLTRLGKILGSEKATTALRSGKTLEEAEIYVDSREESVERLSKVTKELGVLLKKKLLPKSKTKAGLRLLEAYNEFETAAKLFISEEP